MLLNFIMSLWQIEGFCILDDVSIFFLFFLIYSLPVSSFQSRWFSAGRHKLAQTFSTQVHTHTHTHTQFLDAAQSLNAVFFSDTTHGVSHCVCVYVYVFRWSWLWSTSLSPSLILSVKLLDGFIFLHLHYKSGSQSFSVCGVHLSRVDLLNTAANVWLAVSAVEVFVGPLGSQWLRPDPGRKFSSSKLLSVYSGLLQSRWLRTRKTGLSHHCCLLTDWAPCSCVCWCSFSIRLCLCHSILDHPCMHARLGPHIHFCHFFVKFGSKLLELSKPPCKSQKKYMVLVSQLYSLCLSASLVFLSDDVFCWFLVLWVWFSAVLYHVFDGAQSYTHHVGASLFKE